MECLGESPHWSKQSGDVHKRVLVCKWKSVKAKMSVIETLQLLALYQTFS